MFFNHHDRYQHGLSRIAEEKLLWNGSSHSLFCLFKDTHLKQSIEKTWIEKLLIFIIWSQTLFSLPLLMWQTRMNKINEWKCSPVILIDLSLIAMWPLSKGFAKIPLMKVSWWFDLKFKQDLTFQAFVDMCCYVIWSFSAGMETKIISQ